MILQTPPRVMWLLNHGTARKFELSMLKAVGIKEIFLPKKFPSEIKFRSASVDYSEDVNLTIPPEDLAILNDQSWYATPSPEAWAIANKHFDIVFFIVHDENIIIQITKHFKGIALWRAFGLDISITYSKLLGYLQNGHSKNLIKSLGKRFYFAEAYDHLHKIEEDFIQERNLFLPLGLQKCDISGDWSGSSKKIFFICPCIRYSPYYNEIYEDFIKNFKGLSYAIGGEQTAAVSDPNVLGFVSQEQHDRNMREMRVMFYHSQEPNHIHYHPFEAIKAGMPLVFMGGGILDRMGGKGLPGRCTTMKEARRKIQRILNDDWVFIKKIQQSQVRMLEPMKVENCIDAWHRGFDKVLKNLEKIKKNKTIPTKKQKRIAVILPVEYKGGTLRGAKLLAQAIKLGANQAGEDVEVIFCYLEGHYTDEDFSDLPPYIKRRPYEWHLLNQKEAKRTLNYIDLEHTLPSWGYMWINDQMSQLMDCDLLVVVSDRLSFPLLPLKPYVVMAYDYLQRYENFLPEVLNNCFLAAAHAAERVWVTTEFTRTDAIQFAGLSEDKVIKLPMLAPIFSKYSAISTKKTAPPYFVWTTNAALHKNHENAFKALAIYYEKYKGTLECHVTGVDTKYLTTSEKQHLRPLNKIVKNCTALSRNLKLLGNLSESAYQFQLENAQFLWHAGRIDNGTFSVVEAAGLGIPGLSSDYPAMRAIDEQFSLNLHWMDAHIPEDMAIQLKKMEVERNFFQSRLPSHEVIANQSVEKLSDAYWEAVKECL